MKKIVLILMMFPTVALAQQTQTFSNYFKGLNTASTPLSNEPTIVLQGGVAKQIPLSQTNPSSVVSFGADPTGIASSTTAFSNAATAAGTLGTVLVPSGTYNLPTQPTWAQTLFIGTGGQLNSWPTGVNVSVAETSPLWTYRVQSAAGTNIAGSADQFAQAFFTNIPVTNSAASYEKSAMYVGANCQDPSVFGSIDRGCVAFVAQASADPANTQAELFGGNIIVTYNSGSVGSGVVTEFDSNNSTGVAAGEVGTSTAKTGITAVAQGNARSTVGMEVLASSGTAIWTDGVAVPFNAITRNAFSVPSSIDATHPLWLIDSTGNEVHLNSGVDAYEAFIEHNVQAFSIGINHTSNDFQVSSVQGLGSNILVDIASSGFASISRSVAVGSPTGGDEGAGTINVANSYYANGTQGVSCAAGTVSLVTLTITNGIVTHC